MLSSLLLLAATQTLVLSKAENAMVAAIQKRDVVAIRKLMKKRVTLVTVVPSKEAILVDDEYPDMYMGTQFPERCLVFMARFESNSKGEEIKVNLERMAKNISQSFATPGWQPQIVKSFHNDLTKRTIRGTIAPEVYWELHYDVDKRGKICLQRICEFDHSPKFVW